MATKVAKTLTQSLYNESGIVGGSNFPHSATWVRNQRTSSTGHPFRLLGKTQRDVGGSFVTQSTSVEGTPALVDVTYGSWYMRGQVVPHPSVWGYSSNSYIAATPESDLIPMGSTAISRCAPVSPHAGVVVAITEMKEGLPRIPGEAIAAMKSWRHLPRSVANEHLNAQFGIAPLLSDVRKFATSIRDSRHILEEYARNSGCTLHRRFDLPTETSVLVNSTAAGYPFPTGVTQLHRKTGTVTVTTTNTTERWFSGAFTYYVPSSKDLVAQMRRRVQLANHILGTTPSVELLWELLPFSWAVDWVTNVGDVLHNASMAVSDGLILRYGYLMEHKRQEVQYCLSGHLYKDGSSGDGVATITKYVKTRVRATPFGFGLNPSSFSARQWSLIAALGISRAPRSLDS